MKIILKRTIPNSQCRVESVENRESQWPKANGQKPKEPAIDGTLTINGQYVCDTVENALTALPPGEYRIVRHYCKQYARKMPLVIAAKSQRPKANSQKPIEPPCNRCKRKQHVGINTTMPLLCPMLKPGNGVHGRTDGSIILGTRLIPGCLKHPHQAFGPLYQRIRKAIERGKEVTLVIKD